jgi:hypothetical protein
MAKNARPVVAEDVLFAKMYRAYTRAIVGEPATAERDLRCCIAGMIEKLGPAHRHTLQASGHLCEVLLGARKLVEAESRSRALYGLCVSSGTHVQFARSTLARVLRETSKVSEAEALLRQCEPSSSTMRAMLILLYRQRRFMEAAECAKRSLAINLATYGAGRHEETDLDSGILYRINRRIGNGEARCAECGAREPKPKRCGGCLAARYCGVACQKAHRASHRGACAPP